MIKWPVLYFGGQALSIFNATVKGQTYTFETCAGFITVKKKDFTIRPETKSYFVTKGATIKIVTSM